MFVSLLFYRRQNGNEISCLIAMRPSIPDCARCQLRGSHQIKQFDELFFLPFICSTIPNLCPCLPFL